MPNFDRGFIKWLPFNSVIPSKEVINSIDNKQITKPILFPEELEIISAQILEAYYSQNTIKITFYEQDKILNMETKITHIHTHNNTIKLNNHKIISFNQIISIT